MINNCVIFKHFRGLGRLSWGSCLLCRRPIALKRDFCGACLDQLPVVQRACRVCADTLEDTDTAVCGRCQSTPPAFDRTLAWLHYRYPVNHIIHALKYQARLHWARALGLEWARHLLALNFQSDALVPVPLHRRRLAERGYNQSLELARLLSRALTVPISSTGLERIRNTPPQTELPFKARGKNIKGAFACRPGLFSGQRVALVDDVMTTGNTANEVARILKQAGASEVLVLVLARA